MTATHGPPQQADTLSAKAAALLSAAAHEAKHHPHPDIPPVAATESGGPLTSPGQLDPVHKYAYSVVPGFFLQSGPEPKHVAFEELLDKSFGLIDQSPERWQNLRRDVAALQASAEPNVAYKVMFLGRHGQGWHNFAASKYGVDAWETHYTYLLGDGELVWGPDPELTPLGHEQTLAIQAAWRRELPHGAPINPDEIHWFVSPLTRTCQTMLNSWGDLLKGTPETWEDFREIYGSHTCDRRSSKAYISKRFPMVKIEDGFTEEDELWRPDDRETNTHMQHRMRRAMDRIFDGAATETYISITAHGAILSNLLAVLGHQAYPLTTGEMIPVVVKATKL
ncbi:putative phosphoglycerate mutase pmu1 [Vanrija albida]|uniref:Phosphoglycerate mutase pmu1 n=1 Tax=Vanrija albida TaxID=181172 RepID=A0ABR3PV66_9TREE